MLADLTVVEQGYKAVLEVIEQAVKVTDVALRYGVDRRTLQRWIAGYLKEGGLAALANRIAVALHRPACD